jgi:hypothetical protein
MDEMRYLKAFIAGFVAVLLFHQGAVALLFLIGATARGPYEMNPTWPFGVPQVFSRAFWGGLWGIALWLVLDRVRTPVRYWTLAVALGILGPTLVAWFVVLPLRGQPVAGGWEVAAMLRAFVVNGAFGLGVAVLMRLLEKHTPVSSR